MVWIVIGIFFLLFLTFAVWTILVWDVLDRSLMGLTESLGNLRLTLNQIKSASDQELQSIKEHLSKLEGEHL